MDSIRLRVAGRDFPVWNDIRVLQTIQHLAGEFELKVWGNWSVPGIPRQQLAGQPCQIFIGKDRVLTGYIDATPVDYDANSHILEVKGRSKTADLVDCSVLTEDMGDSICQVNATLVTVARDVCPHFGIEVIDEVGDIGPLRLITPNLNATVFEMLDALARIAGVLLTSDANGNLVITRAGRHRSTDALVLGENVIGAHGGTDLSQCFSDYLLREQDMTSSLVANDPEAKLLTKKVATDPRFQRLGRHRPYTMDCYGPLNEDMLQTRVNWERNVRLGRSQPITYTVKGWRQSDGALWKPNRVVHVKDAYQGIDGDRLITDVAYRQVTPTSDDVAGRDSGTRCDITVMPVAAFSVIAHPEEDHL